MIAMDRFFYRILTQIMGFFFLLTTFTAVLHSIWEKHENPEFAEACQVMTNCDREGQIPCSHMNKSQTFRKTNVDVYL